jgi:hypothetical protein
MGVKGFLEAGSNRWSARYGVREVLDEAKSSSHAYVIRILSIFFAVFSWIPMQFLIYTETRSLNCLDHGPVQQPNLRSWGRLNVLTTAGQIAYGK